MRNFEFTLEVRDSESELGSYRVAVPSADIGDDASEFELASERLEDLFGPDARDCRGKLRVRAQAIGGYKNAETVKAGHIRDLPAEL